MMEYVITSGVPGQGPCAVTGYDGQGTCVYYRGWFDPRKETWRLYPLADTPREHRHVVVVGMRYVRTYRPARAEEKRPEPKKAEDKPKAWWALPDPEGQMRIE